MTDQDQASTAQASAGGYTLDELCDRAGVTVRTVRYYIGEGLLPPPQGHGTAARYGEEHLDRLRVIAALKEQYLPLREIRRALDGMSPRQLRDTAATIDQPARAAGRRNMQSPIAGGRAMRTEATPPAARALREESSAAHYIADVLDRSPPRRPRPGALPPAGRTNPDDPGAWRRIAISDEAELLITDEAWQRRREQIESLVAWARRILKGP